MQSYALCNLSNGAISSDLEWPNADFKGTQLCWSFFEIWQMIITLIYDFEYHDTWSLIWTLFRHVRPIIPIRLYDQSEQLVSVLYIIKCKRPIRWHHVTFGYLIILINSCWSVEFITGIYGDTQKQHCYKGLYKERLPEKAHRPTHHSSPPLSTIIQYPTNTCIVIGN